MPLALSVFTHWRSITQSKAGLPVNGAVVGGKWDASHNDARVVVDGGLVHVLAFAAELHLFDAAEGFGAGDVGQARVALCEHYRVGRCLTSALMGPNRVIC